MSGGFNVNVTAPKNAWRQRGYQDAVQGRDKPRDDVPEQVRSFYLAGFRRGREKAGAAA